jgi:hypothetical protein
MKFTRQQELALIEIGLRSLIGERLNPKKRALKSTGITDAEPVKKRKKRKPMSLAARKAISRRMKQLWKDKQS